MFENKCMGGHVVETKEAQRNGVKVGILEGYIATWDMDTGQGARFGVPDRFVQGAFADSIQEHKDRKNRQVRFKDHHGRTVGGWPIDNIKEDNVGIFGAAEVNLETQQGAELYSLAKQDVLVDFSVGFSVNPGGDKIDNDERVILSAVLWEGSIVDEPMNRKAQITQVKSANPFVDLPVYEGSHTWDAKSAEANVAALTFKEGEGRHAYLDAECKILIADVIEGKLHIIPEALFAAAEELKTQDSPPQELVRHIERYCSKMSKPSPFDEESKAFFNVEEVKAWTRRNFEEALINSGAFSKGASKLLASRMEEQKKAGVLDLDAFLHSIRASA
jgi:HK97 family phage prohead protease